MTRGCLLALNGEVKTRGDIYDKKKACSNSINNRLFYDHVPYG